MITGEDLIQLGYKPGKWFKDAIDHANREMLIGEDFKAYIDSVAPKHIELRDEPMSFHKNIRAENESFV